jgi:putative endonuclease
MFYFYVLYSLKDKKLYKGFTSDLGSRFVKHHAGGTPSTKNRRPLVLIYAEKFHRKSEALQREKWSKSAQGGPELVKLLIEKGILCSNKELTS